MTNEILWDWIVWDSNAMLRDFNDMILDSVLCSGVCYRRYAWTDCIYYALNILYNPLSKYHFLNVVMNIIWCNVLNKLILAIIIILHDIKNNRDICNIVFERSLLMQVLYEFIFF